MNGSLKWIGGIAAGAILALGTWLFHTVNAVDKSIAGIQASLTEINGRIDRMRVDEAADANELKASLEKAKDDIEDLQKGKR